MKISRRSHRSFRHTIFIGVLAGSVFSGSGASAEVLSLASISDQVAAGNVSLVEGGRYEAGDPSDAAYTGGEQTYFGDFSGTFIGNGATIVGLRVPLFNALGNMSATVVENLKIEGATEPTLGNGLLANSAEVNVQIDNVKGSGTVTGSGIVGGLIGDSDATVSTSSFSGIVTTTSNFFDSVPASVGGLVGYSTGDISDSSSSGSVNGDSGDLNGNYTGGLVGYTTGNISQSNSSATVTGFNYVGGLAGYVTNTISGSEATGNVTNTSNPDTTESCYCADFIRTGGLVGETTSTISNSSAHGNVNANANKLGGLVGLAGGNIDYSFATGDVTGTGSGWDVGGLVGFTTNRISNSYSNGSVSGWRFVGGLAGLSADILNSYVYTAGSVRGADGYVGGLVGQSEGKIENSYVDIQGDIVGVSIVGGLSGYAYDQIEDSSVSILGSITGQSSNIGGLVGYTSARIFNSTANVSGDISGDHLIGGLAGYTSADIENSFAFIDGAVNAVDDKVGGIAGESWGLITNTFSMIGQNIEGLDYVGGLVGYSAATIQNSGVKVLGDIRGSQYVGGLVGYSFGSIENSDVNVLGYLQGDFAVGGIAGYFANDSGRIDDSDSNIGFDYVRDANKGGLIGQFFDGTVQNSYFAINGNVGGVTDSVLFGLKFDANFPVVDFTDPTKVWEISNLPESPTRISLLNGSSEPTPFAINLCRNNGKPHLVELFTSYRNECPSYAFRSTLREFRETLRIGALDKIENSFGFKNESPLPKNAAISFVETTEKIDLANVKAVEISPTANVRVDAKAGEALQISLKSESKEPVELWVKSPDGTWLLAGVITFDKDGKAILPPLQFKSAGDFTLVLNKQSADSAKGSAPTNQIGSLLVEVI